jgi:hypothetical protein
MRPRAPRALRALPAILAVGCASSAYAIGAGVEGGGTATFTSFASGPDYTAPASQTAGGAAAGIIVDEEFTFLLLFMDLWGDIQLPTYRLQTGGSDAAAYLPVDLGFRAGLNFALIHPYVGVLGQMAFVNSDGGGPSLSSPIFGLGGDIGLDVAVLFFRFGVEVRGVNMLPPIVSGAMSGVNGAFALQGLGSVRVEY